MKVRNVIRVGALVAAIGCAGLVAAWMSSPKGVAEVGGERRGLTAVIEAITGPSVPGTCAELAELVHTECEGLTAASGTWRLRYRPAELGHCPAPDDQPLSTVVRAVGERKRSEEYVLEIPVEGSDGSPFLDHLNAGAAGDIVEVVGTDTITCGFVHVEAGPSFLPLQRIILGFDRPQDGADRTVLVRDPKGLLKRTVRFDFAPGVFARYNNAVMAALEPNKP